METVFTRRFKRHTGIEADWNPDTNRMVAILPRSNCLPWFWMQDGDPKRALALLLQKNLERIRAQRLTAVKGACETCGRRRPLQLHHIKFRSQGRDDREGNLRLECGACHDLEHGG